MSWLGKTSLSMVMISGAVSPSQLAGPLDFYTTVDGPNFSSSVVTKKNFPINLSPRFEASKLPARIIHALQPAKRELSGLGAVRVMVWIALRAP